MQIDARLRRLLLLPAWGAFLLGALSGSPALAQDDDGLVDIEVGSRRIGGPGATAKERAMEDWEEEAETILTPDTLPPPGDPKRLPGLHILARRSAGGKQWEEACDRYDQIVNEGGEEAMNLDPGAKRDAHRSYLGCAELLIAKSEFGKAEAMIKKSERYGSSGPQHVALRRKMAREEVRAAMANADVDKAVQLFNTYNAAQADEDERIWIGEQLAQLAWQAHRDKDEARLAKLRGHLDKIAPQNTAYRKLKEKVDGQTAILQKVFGLAILAMVLVFGTSKLSRAISRARLKSLSSKVGGNKYLDE